jgi:hypothetical protein
MKNDRHIALVLAVIAAMILLLALQIVAFAGSLPAPTSDNTFTPSSRG